MSETWMIASREGSSAAAKRGATVRAVSRRRTNFLELKEALTFRAAGR
jgi:hypothetical protein